MSIVIVSCNYIVYLHIIREEVMIKVLYSILLVIGALIAFFARYSDGNDVFINLAILLLIYRPLIDYIFIRKLNLYTGDNLWKRYPFYKFSNEILFGKTNK